MKKGPPKNQFHSPCQLDPYTSSGCGGENCEILKKMEKCIRKQIWYRIMHVN